MLVNIVQTMQNLQFIVPTLVWLKKVEFLHCEGVKSRYFSSHSIFGISVIRRALEYGEGSLGIHFSVNTLDHCPCQMIESSSEILNSVPGDERNFNPNWGHVLNEIMHISRLWVALGAQSIWVGYPTGVPEGIEITDVLIGPIDLGRDVKVNRRVCHSLKS
jgi:hypothetical protein